MKSLLLLLLQEKIDHSRGTGVNAGGLTLARNAASRVSDSTYGGAAYRDPICAFER
jgi:hypothetical protein